MLQGVLDGATNLLGVLHLWSLDADAQPDSQDQQLGSLIANHPDVFEEVRGKGLMLGLKLKVPNGDFLAAMMKHRILGVGAGDNVIRLLPPLVIEESHVREAIEKLEAAARDVEATMKKTEAA